MLRERTDRAWFSRLLWHPARTESGSILTTPHGEHSQWNIRLSNYKEDKKGSLGVETSYKCYLTSSSVHRPGTANDSNTSDPHSSLIWTDPLSPSSTTILHNITKRTQICPKLFVAHSQHFLYVHNKPQIHHNKLLSISCLCSQTTCITIQCFEIVGQQHSAYKKILPNNHPNFLWKTNWSGMLQKCGQIKQAMQPVVGPTQHAPTSCKWWIIRNIFWTLYNLRGGVKYNGVGKICFFWTEIAVYLG